MAWDGRRQRGRHPLSTYWLITHTVSGMRHPYTTILGGEALPVFGFEEEAGMFLEFASLGGRRRIQRATTVELLSVLSGPCKDLGWVAFDPLPEFFAKSAPSRMERRKFMAFLAGRRPDPAKRRAGKR